MGDPDVINDLPSKVGADFDMTQITFAIYGFLLLLMMILRPQGLIPERTLWSARVGFDGTFMEGRCRAGVELGVTNLFDEEYFDRNGNKGIVPGPSRQMYLQFLVSFDF